MTNKKAPKRNRKYVPYGDFGTPPTCGRKLILTKNQARTRAARLSKLTGVHISAYKCYDGNHWHVGGTPEVPKLPKRSAHLEDITTD